MSLQFINAEKRINDSVIFPSFDLSAERGKVVAVYSSVNIREQLIGLLVGKNKLSNGEIRIGEDDIPGNKHQIGFFFLNSGLYERLSIVEMIQFTKSIYSSAISVAEVINSVQLGSKRNVKIKQLSYSEKKRVQLACLLIQNPFIYILEEPDQNLDLETKRILLTVLDEIRLQKKVVFILTGNLESAVNSSDEVWRLDENGLHGVQIEEQIEADNEMPSEEEINVSNEQTVPVVQPVKFEKIPTKVNDKIVLFDPIEIDYIESNEGQSFLHIKGESFPSVFTLNDLEQRLLPFGFFRCHRSYIVNLQRVREVITWTRNSYSLVLEDAKKSSIPLSKTKMAELKEMLGL
ncbi:LytTR family transcriptional regulator DNA-binding domain-containing protein [Sporosarcina thermotolerans]|uniref:LytTR family transcriptional regulator DNA-binding domain-containing protein n=1 Tax=Sporosarcina thermotolerans TaxID=633404 RepID=A0AAW9ABG1_9BACL|nr:LytTR family transcriptional regulator DNA-binding domain-containing protein [Sporosarcina thermotolerans]MDW0118842.1 LytTR family transcriptional regulator DNA-binding domain-containing protein [Sporosarcina thermotolerans]WHT48451.1 LytTR family transcriptional regulator DNA-binding domain-containing protein [Sporosarcina thermotolerans]